jgi:hypothetical protein
MAQRVMQNGPVLVIRNAQLDVLRIARERECELRLARLVAQCFPRDAERLGAEGVQALVQLGMARSRQQGHGGERDMAIHLLLMVMLGSHFDEDPQLPWCQALLRGAASLTALHQRALVHLDAVAGEDNGHLVRALVRVQALEPAALPAVAEADFEPRMLQLLASVYPAKFAAQDPQASLQVVRLGARLADSHAMPGGAALLALLVFFLGTGVDRDPVHPWVQDVLQGPQSGAARTDALLHASLDFVADALR